jgi:predicted Zn-dependent protease
MLDRLETRAQRVAPAVDHWAVRGVVERSEQLVVRQNIAQAPSRSLDAGAMVTVCDRGGMGYAGTSDLSEAGLVAAFEQARSLAHAAAGRSVFDASLLRPAQPSGRYASRVEKPLASLKQRYSMLVDASAATGLDSRIVDWTASLWTVTTQQLYLTSEGARAEQQWSFVVPAVQATAHDKDLTQTRSSAGQYNGYCQQGGMEVLERASFASEGPRVAREALELVAAPQCPSGEMDVILMPDQMMLQIHESIGHPLELDRILGDERNFAGTSFVTLDMFGHYMYGSELLNVTYDPSRGEQFASFAFDDDGSAATREYVIEHGRLLRPLGGEVSLARARAQRPDLQGVATTRACSWNRAPIDRMSNLNVEPGDATLDAMIGSIERGVLMHTNCSWSIDDSRNKFQFGCEYARVIRDGRLGEVVRNPNYRGISATFWRSLSMVGDAGTVEVLGTPFCGKGEPSQVIRCGHAAPACKFSNVAVFGGQE